MSPEDRPADVALPGTPPAGAPQTAPPRGSRGTVPLSAEEWARADRVARRVHAELTELLGSLPPAARHASGLARHLEIDRTTCQRAVYVATRPYAGPGLFARLPGVRGLRLLAEAAGRADPPAEAGRVDALVAALDQYQRLVSTLGGSLARLQRRLELGPGSGGGRALEATGATDLRAQARLFEAAEALTGRSSDCWVAVYAQRPTPGDPDTVEVYRANGLVGHRARADAVPLVVANFTRAPDERDTPGALDAGFRSLDQARVEGRSPTVVLEDFSSDPAPLVTARQPGEFLVQAIDTDEALGADGVDLMLASRAVMPHPATQSPALDEVWALVNFPCRHLLFDVYLHRDLARACVPSLDTHLWGPDFARHVGDRWQTRFADAPPLQLLGPGIPRRSPPSYARMTELTGHLFGRVDLDPDEFVGFRCETAFPMWRTGYRIGFDYTRPAD